MRKIEKPAADTSVVASATDSPKRRIRRIEEQMLEAIRQRKNWSSGNTMVIFDPDVSCAGDMANTYEANVFLHGNHIATVSAWGNHCDRDTFKRWPTRTTVSRLRALGINASVRKGKACIDGKEI